jgi:transcriptional regulator with XRE-family HTH domain
VTTSLTVRRRRLASELRRLREKKGLTIEQVASALECSDSKVSRIENAKVTAGPRDVRDMLALYDVSAAERDTLLRIAREARRKDWWHEYEDLPHTFAGLESGTESLRMYASAVIPGLLQTERYARLVLSAILPQHDRDDIERRVQFRMDRQARLGKEGSPRLWVVLDEAALRRTVGGKDASVMSEQLAHLIEMADLPAITLQVLPFSVGQHAGMDGDFTILQFPEKPDPDVVYIETTFQDSYFEGDKVVELYHQIFDHLRAAALAPADSKQFFATVAEERKGQP